MIIEPAKESDLGDIVNLTTKEFPYTEKDMPYSRFKKKNVHYFVAKVKDIVVGFIDIEEKGKLVGVAVKEEHRGKGIGSELIDYALAKFKEWGVKKIELFVKTDNPAAQHIYRKKGFVYSRDYYDIDGHPAIVMELEL